MRGTVHSYDRIKKAGLIRLHEDDRLVPVTERSLAMSRSFLCEGEEVCLEVSRVDGLEQALNVVSFSKTPRCRGRILFFNQRCGYIAPEGGGDEIFFHGNDLRGAQGSELKCGQLVEFEKESIAGMTAARQIVCLEHRSPLEMLASLSGFPAHLAVLASLAEPEHWDLPGLHDPEGHGGLRDYIEDTFARVVATRRMAEGVDAGGHPALCFNTGLATPSQDALFGYLEWNGDSNANVAWSFVGFLPESDSRLACFGALPGPVAYAEVAADLVYDPSFPLLADYDAIMNGTLELVPCIDLINDAPLRPRLEDAVRRALASARRNFRIAVPAYFNSRVHLLLPLALRSRQCPDLALALAKVGAAYRSSTVLTLAAARRTGRLLAPLGGTWLASSSR